MRGHLFLYAVFATLMISCNEPTVETSYFYGEWEISDAYFDEVKIDWGEQSPTAEYMNLLNSIKEDVTSSKGERWLFNPDSSFYAESSNKNPSYWIYNKSLKEIQFSNSREPFDINYIYKVEIADDAIIMVDIMKDVGTTTTILKKSDSKK